MRVSIEYSAPSVHICSKDVLVGNCSHAAELVVGRVDGPRHPVPRGLRVVSRNRVFGERVHELRVRGEEPPVPNCVQHINDDCLYHPRRHTETETDLLLDVVERHVGEMVEVVHEVDPVLTGDIAPRGEWTDREPAHVPHVECACETDDHSTGVARPRGGVLRPCSDVGDPEDLLLGNVEDLLAEHTVPLKDHVPRDLRTWGRSLALIPFRSAVRSHKTERAPRVIPSIADEPRDHRFPSVRLEREHAGCVKEPLHKRIAHVGLRSPREDETTLTEPRLALRVLSVRDLLVLEDAFRD